MIGVGINENVVLTGAEIKEKGVLALSFDNVANLNKEKADVFDSFSSAKVEDGGDKVRSLNIFPFKVPSGPKNEGKTQDELLEMIGGDMLKVKNQLTQLLQVYLTTDNIKWEPFLGTGVDKSNYRDRYLDNDALAKIFANYASQFITMVTPFLGKIEYKLRLKLVRQSKDKHFATIPGRWLEDNPYVEVMDIPKDQSKVKFTQWEIDNGYASGTPVPKATADATTDLPEAATTVAENVFGNR